MYSLVQGNNNKNMLFDLTILKVCQFTSASEHFNWAILSGLVLMHWIVLETRAEFKEEWSEKYREMVRGFFSIDSFMQAG